MQKWKIFAWICVIGYALSWMNPVFANSAQTMWYGVDASGAVVMDVDSPIVVEHEALTLDIQEFPNNYYSKVEDFLKYDAKVQAEYTFYNPEDYAVTMRLAFPFGNEPYYAYFYDYENDITYHNVDTEKYGIYVNEQRIKPTLRYTFNSSWHSFNLEEDLPKLLDDYIEDEFYSLSLPVAKYRFRIDDVNENEYHAASVAFDYDGGSGASKLLFVNQSGFHTQEDGDGRISTWATKGDELVVYVLGEDFVEFPKWSFYADGGVEDHEEIDGSVSLVSKDVFSFEEFVFYDWKEEYGISKIDWYNAFIAAMENYDGFQKYNVLDFEYSSDSFLSYLMRWYEYEITLGPKEKVINRVTAPIYPAIDGRYEPPVYEYTYLLSPASTYAQFRDLDIQINSPFYMIESSIDGFEKSEQGYRLSLESLPEGELVFSLSSEENPSRKSPPLGYYLPLVGMVGIVLFGIIGILLFNMFRKNVKNRN